MSPEGGGGPLDDMKDALKGALRGAADKIDLEGLKSSLEQMVTGDGDERELSAEVTSAVALTGAERQALETRLHAKYGEELPIRFRVEPSILGGLIVRVGDRYLDGSVASRLARMRDELSGSRAR